MNSILKRLAFATVIVISVSTLLFGWGQEGHAIIGQIAQDNLTPAAKKQVQALLGNETLASVASWADEIRRDRDETYNWHFVDIPKDAAGFDDARDCYRPNDTHKGAQTDHQNCVVDRIEFFKKVLADKGAPQDQRVEALKFVVHFVGDIHQPFHGIDEAKGGNGIHVNEFGSPQCGKYPCNLHAAWDSDLIGHTGMDMHQYVTHLEEVIQQEHLTATGDPRDWANESHDLAKEALLPDGGAVDQAYYDREIKVVDQRLALAGLRLAALLNSVLR